MKQKIKMGLWMFLVFTILILGIVALMPYVEEGRNNVILNEICAYNDSIIYDTIGGHHDYIELYNPSDEVKDISGYGLSDNKDELNRYVFPENTILESGEYKLLWGAIWTEDILAGDETDYVGFSVSAGETIFLSDKEGNVIDMIKIPSDIERDTAYSCVSVVNHVWRKTEASPGAVNYREQKQKPKLLKSELVLSAESGFYEEPFYLEMSIGEDCDIYYTTDGSKPTVDSLKYEKPILIEDATNSENRYTGREDITLTDFVYNPFYNVEKTNVIRAIAITKDGRKVSEEVNATYFVEFDEKSGFDNLPVISIVTDPDNLFGYEDGIYVLGKIWDINKSYATRAEHYEGYMGLANFKLRGSDWERETKMYYFDVSKELVYEQQIAIEIHGRSSALNNQKSFNLMAMPEVDGNEYVFPGLFGQYESTLVLRNGGWRDCYLTKLRDVFTQELVKDRAFLTADYQPCQVFLNGEYWGLYMLQERIGESAISSRYQVEEENIIVVKNDEVVSGEPDEINLWTEMVDFAIENDLSIEENYRKMEEMIDIQSLIDYYSFQTYVANSDSLSNNYARWRTRTVGDGPYEDGKWRFVLYDIDDAIEREPWTDSFIEGNYAYNALQDKLFVSLIANQEFKERFVVSFMDMANVNFDAQKAVTRLNEIENLLSDAMVVSQRRFYNEQYEVENYVREMNVLKSFFEERYGYIVWYLEYDLGLQGHRYEVILQNGVGGQVELNTLTIDEEDLFKGYYHSDYEIILKAKAKDGYKFNGWSVNGEYDSSEELHLSVEKEYTIVPIWDRIN